MAAIVLTSTVDMPYEKWLGWRRKGIGGFDVSVVCGVNNYKSPIELFMEKTGQQASEEAGEAAYWGKVLKSVVKAEFTKQTGIKVIEVNKLLYSKEYPYMLANLDGVCRHPAHGNCVFETKTASAYKAAEWDNDIPIEYRLQVQHYLTVTGYAGAFIAVLIGGNTFKYQFIERDEELISMLVTREADFWEHVRSDIPPALDGSKASALYLKKRYPTGVSQSKITLPHAAIELIRQYEEACGKGDQYTEQKQRAENLLKEMLGEHEMGIAGNKIITWKTFNREQVDSKTLKADHPDLYKQYANQTPYRRFNVKAVG